MKNREKENREKENREKENSKDKQKRNKENSKVNNIENSKESDIENSIEINIKSGEANSQKGSQEKKSLFRKMEKLLEHHKTGITLMKIAHKVDSSAIPLRIINTLINVIGIYLGLYLTAGFIDLLLAGRYLEGFYQGCLKVGIELLLGAAGQLVAKAYARSSQRYAAAFAVMMREKAASLDYETMEQPQVADKIFMSERTANMYGGLGAVVINYQGMLSGLLEIGASLGMISMLCFSRPVLGDSLLAFAARPAASVALLILFLGATALLRAKMNSSAIRNSKEYLQDHTGMEMKISYLFSRIMMNLQAAKVIRIYDMKRMLMENIEKCSSESNQFYGQMCDIEIKSGLRSNLINGFFTVFSYLFVAVKALAGAITVGAFTQYAGALAKLSDGFEKVSRNNTRIKMTNTYMKDFLELMEMENSHATGTIPVEKRLDGEYEIEFKDVSFHYPGSEEMILKHVNCRLTMKNKLALVGKNGAGKTTFTKLLCRLYEPTEGVITLNGIDIRKYREEEYRELFGVVFQDFKLFAFPLWQNLAAGYARDDGKIRDSLNRAGAWEFVKGLPQGIDTLLLKDREGGVDISGGEAQKLALARALYKDAPFVVLDEPTAALDPISEAEVYAGFHEMVKDKTSIYISHRMSSCRFCDDIVVFEDGRIAERGSHEELLEKKGQYAEMWHSQAKYYVDSDSGAQGAEGWAT